EFKIDSKGLR
ncbi:hypothetical protein D043_0645B, partial [Vibrio parahaemolyticus EKP-021]